MARASKDTVRALESRHEEIAALYDSHDGSDRDVAAALGVSYATLWDCIDQSPILQEAKASGLRVISEDLKKRTVSSGRGKLQLAKWEFGPLVWAGKNFAGLTDRAEVGQSVRVEYATAPRDESEGKASPFVPTVVRLPVDGGEKGEGSAGSEG